MKTSPRSNSRVHSQGTALRLASLLFLLALPMAQLSAQQQVPITPNLLTNPGAEAGNISSWTAGGFGTPIADNGTFDPGINPHTGSYDFAGGVLTGDGNTDSLSQTISLLAVGFTAGQLDSGTLDARLSFWEQSLNEAGTGVAQDDASITLTFLDGSGNFISSMDSGEVDSFNGTWQNYTNAYPLPSGTRYITYTMNFIQNIEGSQINAFVDDNNLTISSASTLELSSDSFTPGTFSLDFGNQLVNTQSAAEVVTVTNGGDTTINISQIAANLGVSPTDFLQTNNCPAALAANASCQINVTFVPNGVGLKTAGVGIANDSAFATTFFPQQISLSGTGTGGIVQVNPGSLKTIAGNGTPGATGNGGPAPAAELNQPNGIAFDPAGNLYIADTVNNVVRKVDTTGIISIFAGTGVGGFSGDNGLATAAELLAPFSVTSDATGNIYIQDSLNYVIRKVDTSGIITTFAGTPGQQGHGGDGGPATAATFNENQGARFDSAGNLFVPQCAGASIRRIDVQGNISTVAGTFVDGFSGDGGPATSAQLNCPSGVAIDAAGNFYIADEFNNRIRKVTAQGIISTIAGNGTAGTIGDGGPAAAAELNLPNDVTVDAAGNLYIADSGSNRVRKIDANGIITTVAGGLANAGSAAVNSPLGVTTDTAGNLYFSDSGNDAIRELFPAGVAPFALTPYGTTAPPNTYTLSNIGNLPITIASRQSFVLSGNTTDFALTGGTCLTANTMLAPQGTCTLVVSFTPTGIGLRTLTVSIADNALNSPQSFTISGTGTPIAPTITWAAPANIVYGTPLSATQLDAAATGLQGAIVTGTFVYAPAAGTILTAGAHTLSVVFTSTNPDYLSGAASVPITVTQATPTIAWAPPANIVYGTALSAAQLDATATGFGGAAVMGAFAYTPAAGTVLTAGAHTLSATFTSADPNYLGGTVTVPVTVTQAAPTLTWATPASIAYGIPLGAAQLDATVTGVGGTALPGTFTYTPPAGTVLLPGTQTLSVAFAPTDTVDYQPLTGSVSIVVTGLTLNALTPAAVQLGSGDTVITLAGSGFVTNSIVQVNGAAVASTYVNPTTLTTLLPAADFVTAGTLQITVVDPAIGSVSAAQALTVLPLAPAVTLTGPSTTPPGSQPTVGLSITNPYPLDLTATFTLTFASAATPQVDDPAIQFAAGGRTLTIVIPANTTVVPPVQLQAGTDAGTITISLALTAAGINVTPTNLAPVMIDVPGVVPVITGVTITRSVDQLTVVVHGYSNTREMVSTTFDFTAIAGASIGTPSLNLPGTTLFANWFSTPPSDAYGSTFTYTQMFTLSDVATNVASVKVTLTNTVGASTSMMAQ